MSADSDSTASRSVSIRLQNTKRTCVRPSAGSWKKLEPGTVATPRTEAVPRARRRAKASSGSSDRSEKSAKM